MTEPHYTFSDGSERKFSDRPNQFILTDFTEAGEELVPPNSTEPPWDPANNPHPPVEPDPLLLSIDNDPVNLTAGNAVQNRKVATVSGGTTPYTFQENLPTGLTFATSTGNISGTPTTAGTTTVNLSVTDAANVTASDTFSIVVTPAPPPPPPALVVSAVSSTVALDEDQAVPGAPLRVITIAGGTSPYSVAQTLPAGLTFNSANGDISGTPTNSGSSSITATVTDHTGQAAAATYTINVTAAPPPPPDPLVLTMLVNNLDLDEDQAVAGAPVDIASVTGGTAPYTFSQTLPPGLTYDSATGAVSGTPTTAATSTVTLTVADSLGQTDTGQYTITVNAAPPPPPPLLDLTIIRNNIELNKNQPVPGAPRQVATVTGGVVPYTFSQTLPAGLTYSSSTGAISGTPTTFGTTSITITVTDSVGNTDQGTYAIYVAPEPFNIIITNPTVHITSGNTVSNLSLATYTGGVDPVNFAVTNLPAGLTYSSATGNISGTTTVEGSRTITVQASDSNGAVDSDTLTLIIDAAPPPPPGPLTLTITHPTVDAPWGTLLDHYQVASASGGTSPYVFIQSLPAGFDYEDGTLSGQSGTNGDFIIDVNVTDSVGASDSGRYTIHVTGVPDPLVISIISSTVNLNQDSAVPGAPLRVANISGGTAPYTVTQTLPAGLTYDSSTGDISGTPTITGNTSVLFHVTDSVGSPANAAYTIHVDAPPKNTMITGTSLPVDDNNPIHQPTIEMTGSYPVSITGTDLDQIQTIYLTAPDNTTVSIPFTYVSPTELTSSFLNGTDFIVQTGYSGQDPTAFSIQWILKPETGDTDLHASPFVMLWYNIQPGQTIQNASITSQSLPTDPNPVNGPNIEVDAGRAATLNGTNLNLVEHLYLVSPNNDRVEIPFTHISGTQISTTFISGNAFIAQSGYHPTDATGIGVQFTLVSGANNPGYKTASFMLWYNFPFNP